MHEGPLLQHRSGKLQFFIAGADSDSNRPLRPGEQPAGDPGVEEALASPEHYHPPRGPLVSATRNNLANRDST